MRAALVVGRVRAHRMLRMYCGRGGAPLEPPIDAYAFDTIVIWELEPAVGRGDRHDQHVGTPDPRRYGPSIAVRTGRGWSQLTSARADALRIARIAAAAAATHGANAVTVAQPSAIAFAAVAVAAQRRRRARGDRGG